MLPITKHPEATVMLQTMANKHNLRQTHKWGFAESMSTCRTSEFSQTTSLQLTYYAALEPLNKRNQATEKNA